MARTDRILTGDCLRNNSKKLVDYGQATDHLVSGTLEEELVLREVPHCLPAVV